MSKEIIVPTEVLINKIYIVRGHKVMLDKDLAELYDVKAIRLREQVKRNKEEQRTISRKFYVSTK